MEKRGDKILRVYGFGAYKSLINWVLVMIACLEMLLIKYLFIMGELYTKPYELIATFILLPIFAVWLVFIKIGKLKYLLIKKDHLQYKSAFGVVKQCIWDDVDMVNTVELNVNIWLGPQERFASFNKYAVNAEEVERIHREKKGGL